MRITAVRTFNDSVDRASLLAEATVDALSHVNVCNICQNEMTRKALGH